MRNKWYKRSLIFGIVLAMAGMLFIVMSGTVSADDFAGFIVTHNDISSTNEQMTQKWTVTPTDDNVQISWIEVTVAGVGTKHQTFTSDWGETQTITYSYSYPGSGSKPGCGNKAEYVHVGYHERYNHHGVGWSCVSGYWHNVNCHKYCADWDCFLFWCWCDDYDWHCDRVWRCTRHDYDHWEWDYRDVSDYNVWTGVVNCEDVISPATPNPTASTNDWTDLPVDINDYIVVDNNLGTQDYCSGVAEYRYRLYNSFTDTWSSPDWISADIAPSTPPLTLNTDYSLDNGVYEVYIKAYDNAGNPSDAGMTVIKIDNLGFIYVDDDYDSSTPGWQYNHFDSIQDGIDAAEENKTIYVYNATYYENIIVNKTINLIGESRDSVIINGAGNDNVVYISDDWVNISCFTIRNGTNSGNAGIKITSDFNNISRNTITNNTPWGIYLNNSVKNNTVSKNIIKDNDFGIDLCRETKNNTIIGNTIYDNDYDGIYLFKSTDNIILGNNFTHNGVGINLDAFTQNNTVSGNTIFNNGKGIFLEESHYNLIYGNIITLNDIYGIELDSCSEYCIYNNYFDNTNNAYDDGSNIWNITKTSGTNIIGGSYLGGNYWSDYPFSDSDDDGLGDTPYNIPGGSNQDQCPLVLDMVYVDDDYDSSTPGWQYNCFDSIQDGIDAVEENGTVYVYNGTYYENIFIDKSVNLIGENRDGVIIDGSGTGSVVFVFADWVNISGFTVTGSGINPGNGGISLYTVQHCHILNTDCSNNYDHGISLGFASYNTFEALAQN